jgi:transcriptional regulator with XRE-family HTH domain
MTETLSDPKAQLRLAHRLRLARLGIGLSQQDVAERTGIGRVAISSIEVGRRKVSSLELASLARLYRKEPDELLNEGDQIEETDDTVRILARTASQLAPSDRQEVLRFAEYLKASSRRAGMIK